jgi:hypothetical protein
MSNDELERRLRAVPIRALSADAEAEIIAAVRAAAGQARPWHARPIPLWQAAAACLLLCTATWLLGGTGRTATTTPVDRGAAPESSRIVVRLDEPLFRELSPPLNRLDVSRWQLCLSPVTEVSDHD